MDLPAMCQRRICKRVMGQVCPQMLRGHLLLCFRPWLSPLPKATLFEVQRLPSTCCSEQIKGRKITQGCCSGGY